ncbi:MAG: ParB/RepB/Spo0J family partition protein [Sinimarinibacterium flocculans]|uniref:ParB/RepB/Spo0J family partition protein n=1 Tax=Sinimarinibacterium flocculans TaxID=985250 RepID=UPI003C667B50
MSQTATAFAGETAIPYPVLKIAVGRITANEQIRKHFDEEKLAQLGESIKDQGLVQPIVVRTKGESFEIVAGERRWRAAKGAGVAEIPVIVRDDLSDDGAAILQALENLQREDLALGETCAAVAALVAKLGFDETCAKLSKSPAWVSHHSRIGELPEEVQTLVNDGKVESAEIAHMISQLKTYGGGDFKKTVDEFGQANQWMKPPTREQLRERVRWAKERREAKDKEKEKVANSPALQKKIAKEKAQLREQKLGRAERETRCKQLGQEAEQLEKQFTLGLLRLMPGDYSKAKAQDIPVRVRCTQGFYFSHYDTRPLPQSAESAGFHLDFDGPIGTIAPVLNLLAPGAKLSISLQDLSQDDARKIEKALGGRKVTFTHYARNISGKKIRAAMGETKPPKAKPSAEKQGDITVASFIQECCTQGDPDARIKAADLYNAYVEWTQADGATPLAFNDNKWGEAIEAAGIEKKRLKTGVHYLGVKLQKCA